MNILLPLIFILGGMLASSEVIVKKSPEAKEWIHKLLPYEGGIGLVLFISGIWSLIQFLRNIGMLDFVPFAWTIGFVASLVALAVGFILSWKLISSFLFDNKPDAKAKGEELRKKLTAYQVPLGFAAIVLGILSLIVNL